MLYLLLKIKIIFQELKIIQSTAKIKTFENSQVISEEYLTINHRGAFDVLDNALLVVHKRLGNQVLRTNRNAGTKSLNLYLSNNQIVYLEIL